MVELPVAAEHEKKQDFVVDYVLPRRGQRLPSTHIHGAAGCGGFDGGEGDDRYHADGLQVVGSHACHRRDQVVAKGPPAGCCFLANLVCMRACVQRRYQGTFLCKCVWGDTRILRARFVSRAASLSPPCCLFLPADSRSRSLTPSDAHSLARSLSISLCRWR